MRSAVDARAPGRAGFPIEEVLRAVRQRGDEPRRAGAGYSARCPVLGHGLGHGDLHPSLSILARPDGSVLLHCHAGCPRRDIADAFGLQTSAWPNPRGAGNQTHHGPREVVVNRRRGAAPETRARLDRLALAFREGISADERERLAQQLGLHPSSLEALDVGRDRHRSLWTFPMRDGDGHLVGFRLRGDRGRKFALRGSHEGLFLPTGLPTGQRLVVTEGPTDAAALIGLGILAVGRPSCTGAVEHTVRLVRRLRCSEVVLAADQDFAGQRGAATLAATLLLYAAVRVVTPPAKDMRAWVTGAGASAADVARLIDSTPVQRLRVQVAGRSA